MISQDGQPQVHSLDGVREIPLTQIRPSPENRLLYRPVDPAAADVRALADSIREIGVREAFIGRRNAMYPLKNDGGEVKYFQQWPQVAIANKLDQQLTRLEQEFGMTPSARTRIPVKRQRSDDSDGASRFSRIGQIGETAGDDSVHGFCCS